MGGGLFTKDPDDPLDVPRLSPSLYTTLKTQYTTLLKQYYTSVLTPPEAPEKPDHGDIDILVSSPLASLLQSPLPASQTLSTALHATRTSRNGPTTSFALPHPHLPSSHIQLDIHECAAQDLAWTSFSHSYGDLWQILGVHLRPLGLTATDRALFIRVSLLEDSNDRKNSFIALSSSPAAVLCFLGLDADVYARGFETENDLFEWVAGAPWIDARVLAEKSAKSNDRRRYKTRAMFARWVDEYVPRNAHKFQTGVPDEWTRAAVLEKALDHFDKRGEYDAKMAAFRQKERDAAFWEKVGRTVPVEEGEKLNLVVRALKRWVEFEEMEIMIREEANMEEDAAQGWVRAREELDWKEEVLLRWVESNWEEVQRREKMRVKQAKEERAAKKMAAS